MSHFSVAIISHENSHDVIESALAPYDENELIEDYVAETKDTIILNAKQYCQKRISNYEAQLAEWDNPEDYFIIPERLLEIQAEKQKCLDFLTKSDEEIYLENIDEYATYNEHGDRISNYNPDAKWDWWTIGGRWDGCLRLKNGEFSSNAKIGEVDWDGSDERYTYGFVPFAMIHNDCWSEQGEAGWFGSSTATDENTSEFCEEFSTLMRKPELQDYYITIVDCHI